MNEREELIREIESLYPADGRYPAVAAVGAMLLARARAQAGVTWRQEALEVLRLYAALCRDEAGSRDEALLRESWRDE